MATRSTIAIEHQDGTVEQVYCHWDGYLNYVGRILFKHYQDPEKLQQLIDLGSLSSLGPEIGDQHEFDIPFKYGTPEYIAEREARDLICTFYGRDRGESGQGPKRFVNFENYDQKHQYEEYEYILRADGVWYVYTPETDRYQELALALDELEFSED